MNILMLFSHRWRAGRAGGAETHIIELIKGLARKGHEITFVTDRIDPGVSCAIDDFVVAHYELPFRTFNLLDKFSTYKRIEEIIVERHITIIHAHHRTAGYFAELLCRQKRVPYVITVHDRWHRAPFKKLHGNIFRRLIAVSDSIRQVLVKDFHIAAERVKTIHNGIDPAKFEAAEAEKAVLFRQKHGVKEHEVVLTSVGRLTRAKGLADLLRALRLLPEALPYKCLIVGEGKDQPLLQELTLSYGLADRVSFCGYQSNIPVVMAAADIILLPSHREPFGQVILEAMFSHKPVIASAVDGIPEIVTHNSTGILFSPGDVRALAGAMEDLISNAHKRRVLAEEGYKNALNRFCLSEMIDKTETYYLDILSGTSISC
jgi:glycosyltransferase involved in cell wall biosynthesis